MLRRLLPVGLAAAFVYACEPAPEPQPERTGAAAAALTWVPQEKLVPADLAHQDSFGARLALDGTTLAVGAPSHGPGGAVYVYELQGGDWGTPTKIASSAGGANFGGTLALQGDRLVVGAVLEGGSTGGAAYVYERVGGAWVEQQRLTAPDSAPRFGRAVDTDDGRILVTAAGPSGGVGSAYVFEKVAGQWVSQATLTPSVTEPGAGFGFRASMSGDTIAVTAPSEGGFSFFYEGAAYVFVHDGGGWSEQQRLESPIIDTALSFGMMIDVEGDRIIVGEPKPAFTDELSFVHLFKRSAGVWSLEQELSGSTAEIGDALGWDGQILGDRILLGAPDASAPDAASAGALFLFEHQGGSWVETALFRSTDYAIGDEFGRGVALGAGTVVGGADDHDPGATGSETGAVYVWSTTGSACSDASECGTGFCVDGVCCETACDEPCGHCDEPGSEGQCVPDAELSPGEPSCAPFMCDGTTIECPSSCQNAAYCADDAYCYIPGSNDTGVCAWESVDGTGCTLDEQCLSGTCVGGVCCGICDRDCAGCDEGVCGPAPAGSPGQCSPFVCDGTSLDCPSSCTSDLQCPAGLRCDLDTGSCGVVTACLDDHTLEAADGTSIDCAPYRCHDAVCEIACASGADCMDGFVCSPRGACVEPVAPVLVTSCAMGRGRTPAPWGWLALLLPFLRRRRP